MEVPKIRRFADCDVKRAVRELSVFDSLSQHLDGRVADLHRFAARRVDARDVGGLDCLAENFFVRIAEFECVRNQLIQLSLLFFFVRRREAAVRVLDAKNRNRANRI